MNTFIRPPRFRHNCSFSLTLTLFCFRFTRLCWQNGTAFVSRIAMPAIQRRNSSLNHWSEMNEGIRRPELHPPRQRCQQVCWLTITDNKLACLEKFAVLSKSNQAYVCWKQLQQTFSVATWPLDRHNRTETDKTSFKTFAYNSLQGPTFPIISGQRCQQVCWLTITDNKLASW